MTIQDNLKTNLINTADQVAGDVINMVPEKFRSPLNDLKNNVKNSFEDFSYFKKPVQTTYDKKPLQTLITNKPKQTGWQKFKYGLGKFWNVVSAPVKTLANVALPGVGTAIGGIEDIFRRKKQ